MLNKVMLIGNVGADAEKVNDSIAKFTVATSEHWNDKEGVRQEKTEWHKVVVYGKLAPVVVDLVKRGSKVYVEGKLVTNEWTTETGDKRYSTEIKIDMFGTFKLLSSKSEDGGTYQPKEKVNQKPAAKSKDSSSSKLPERSTAPEVEDFVDENHDNDPGDDDIPF